jgi:hypothetical protein
MPRKLIAIADRVYLPLDINGPLVQLDAATGKQLHTYAGTGAAEEVICNDGSGTFPAVGRDVLWLESAVHDSAGSATSTCAAPGRPSVTKLSPRRRQVSLWVGKLLYAETTT